MSTLTMLRAMLIVAGCGWVSAVVVLGASPLPSIGLPTNGPAKVALLDQFEQPQELIFPRTNVVVLTIADQDGSAQIDAWIAAIKARHAGRVELRGLAHGGGAPSFLHGRIRRKFQQARRHPVMIDWSGDVCRAFGYEPHVANVLVLDRSGRIRARAAGVATEFRQQQINAAIEAALAEASGR